MCIKQLAAGPPASFGRWRKHAAIGGFRDTYLGRQVVSRPGGQRAGWGQLGVWGSAASSPSGVWGGAPAEIEFSAFLALKSGNNFNNSVVLPRPQTLKSKIFGEAMPPLASD